MFGRRQKALSALTVFAALIATAGCANGAGGGAGSFPKRDIKVIVPFEPGGGSDLIARALAPCIKKNLATDADVVIQNVTGAGGRTGTFQLYDARPDGYTIGTLEPFTLTIASLTGQSGGRTPERLNWLGQVSAVPMTLTVNAKSGLTGLGDFRGKRVRVAVSQVTLPATIKYLEALGATPRLVYYDGGSETMLATVRGDVDAVVQVAPTVIRAMKANPGAVRVISTLSGTRFKDLPETPTSAELNVPLSPELATISQYTYDFAVPAGTAPAITQKLEGAIAAATRDQSCVEKMRRANLEVSHQNGAQVKRSMRSFQQSLAKLTGELRRATSG
ncbi:Tripartite-type tricarboxylate transporter, receptor component TctC [Actinomadura madurae]|uniref:Tripartite-type tricarboxylate transporter, receptor component TctC n=1 Tax=Actinomadura madurae TaxID=1993 RepID=A0A1I5DJG9_9ACTN|nr:Tripartite-type tricarboxylate transporter, receptor component TctC [Actinomadura madurae]SPT50326.1 Tripartite tricarboxylate transporter family receptor [Actinomadura madurae]